MLLPMKRKEASLMGAVKKPKARSAAKKPAAARRSATVGIKLSPDELERLDALIGQVSQSPAAMEFGVAVDRSVVLRIAVLRGLGVMEQGAAAPRPSVVHGDVSVHAATPKATDSAASSMPRDVEGNVLPPEGWNLWSKRERIPEEQADIHSYYTRQGWKRYWGKSGDETIVFYWTGDERLHDVGLYTMADAKGKKVVVQETPYGNGHLVPHDWVGAGVVEVKPPPAAEVIQVEEGEVAAPDEEGGAPSVSSATPPPPPGV